MNFSDRDIHITWQNNLLTVANRHIRRVVDWQSGMPRTLELTVNQVCLNAPLAEHDVQLVGFPAPGNDQTKTDYRTGAVRVEALPVQDGDGVRVIVESFESLRKLRLHMAYLIYPELPVIAQEFTVQSAVTPMLYWGRRHEEEFNRCRCIRELHTVTDRLLLPDFTVTESIEFQMRTDYYDEPVQRHIYDGKETAVGNILLAQDSAGRKFFYLQEAPPSMERRDHEGYDFHIDADHEIQSLGSGVKPEDIVPDATVTTNRLVLGVAADGDAGTLIKRYLRARQPISARIGGTITANPWGSGNFPARVNQDFLLAEIRAAALLGADSYQIDDGYQTGLGLAEMTVHNAMLDHAYWALNSRRLPNGFSPLAEAAKTAGIALSLWFAPSANREYRDWRESADFLLDFHQRYGVNCFKLDGVLLNSYTAQANFTRLLKTLFKESGGAVAVNLDVTNGIRGGVFKFGEYGSIFLENRYVCHQWPAHPYHPENTLDNLWNLAHHCRIQNLQIEIPSPDDCREDYYTARNLKLPTDYPVEYWAMIAAMASPLLWFAPSTLSDVTAQRLRAVLEVIRAHRDGWRNALVTPVGNRPDGAAITGFYADSGYLLIFRELNAPDSAQLKLPEFTKAELLYSIGEASLTQDGVITLKQAAAAALFHLK